MVIIDKENKRLTMSHAQGKSLKNIRKMVVRPSANTISLETAQICVNVNITTKRIEYKILEVHQKHNTETNKTCNKF